MLVAHFAHLLIHSHWDLGCDTLRIRNQCCTSKDTQTTLTACANTQMTLTARAYTHMTLTARANTQVTLTVKQVTTLPWHFTPKGALFGPIYGIYVG